MSTTQGPATPAANSTPPPVAVGSGETALTFDELDQIDYDHKIAKRNAKNEVKETVKETVKALDKKEEKAKKEAKVEAKEEEEGKETKGKEAGKKEDQKDLAAPETKEEKAIKKLIKAKLQDKELEIDPDVLIPHMIDGKEELVPLKELLSQNAGRVAYDKKFSAFDKERRAFLEKHDEINQKIMALVNETDPELKFFHMAEWAGLDPVEVRSKFLNENMNLLEKWYAMSDDERKADALAYENKIIKYQLESKQRSEASRQAQENLQARITNLGKTHQIPEDEFWDIYDKLEAAKKSGTFNERLSPELVVEVAQKERIYAKTSQALENSELGPDQKRSIILKLVENAYMLNMTPDEAAETARELYATKPKAQIVEEKVKEQEQLRTGKKDSKKQEYSEGGPMFFSDII